MPGLYKIDNEHIADTILVNTVKIFSIGASGDLVPATKLEIHIHNEDKAAALTRLAIHKAMTGSV